MSWVQVRDQHPQPGSCAPCPCGWGCVPVLLPTVPVGCSSAALLLTDASGGNFPKQGRTWLRPWRTMRSESAASAAPNLGIPGNANTNTAGIAQASHARDIPSGLRGFLSWITCAGPRSTQRSPGWLPVICSSLCVRRCLGLLFHSGHQFFQTAES